MSKQLRILKPKRYESLDDFCNRIEESNNEDIRTVGIYNGVTLIDKNKENNKKRYKAKTIKLEYTKTGN